MNLFHPHEKYWQTHIFAFSCFWQNKITMFNVQGNNSLKNSPSPAIKKKCILYNLNFQHQIFYDKQIQSTPSQPISVRPLVILSTHLCLGLQSHLFLPGFPTKIPYTFFSLPHILNACASHSAWFDHLVSTDHGAPHYAIFLSLPLFPHSYTHISTPYAWTSSTHILRLRWQAKFHNIKQYYCDETKGSVMENPVTVCSALCLFYTITLITVFVPTYSVRYVILFRETGVVHRITHSLSYFFLFIY